MARSGTRSQLLALRNKALAEGSQLQYAQVLLENVGAATSIAEAAPQQLAELRAREVQARLLDQGVTPDRLSLGPPKRAEAGGRGLPVDLELSP